jgi:hypothetical protein
MILSKEVEVNITHLNIDHYKSLGYYLIKCNQKIKVKVDDLPHQSNIKILVKCDMCGVEKNLSFQKYKKNIKKYNVYTCSTPCSYFKNKITLQEKYGKENFNRSEENKEKKKEKFDKITIEIENAGYIICSKCNINQEITNYTKNINGRYKKVCRKCRTSEVKRRRKNNEQDMSIFYKEYYRKNIQLYAWRNLLKNYLNRKEFKKSQETHKMLGYSHTDLKEHLESLFTPEMNWENYGLYWQIDHIIPISKFIENTPANIVNSLINLRPLDKLLNNQKGNKLDKDSITIIEKFKQYLKN